MKKIAFIINNFETGGVQKSLLNLLTEISRLYDITVISFFGNKEYEKLIPQNVKVEVLNSPFKHLGMSKKDTVGHPFLYLARAFWFIITRAFGRSLAIKLMGLFQKKIGEFDTAVSYLHEGNQKSLYGGCNEFVLRKIEAKSKIAWLHCDFELCGANNSQSRQIYSKFDKIVACSDGCRNSFVNCMPELAERTVSIRNCNDYEKIRELAGNGVSYDNNFFNIVTVARLSKEKGIERAIRAVKFCVDNGYDIKYHIVGSGIQESLLKTLVLDLGLESVVSFYGNQSNPYKYIKNADLFMLTSYHEAAPMVFDEAACLGVPVLATKTTSTDEMILEANAGYVCENTDEDIVRALFSILSNRENLMYISNELKKREFSNKSCVESIKKI